MRNHPFYNLKKGHDPACAHLLLFHKAHHEDEDVEFP
jgi:hypothetical protein